MAIRVEGQVFISPVFPETEFVAGLNHAVRYGCNYISSAEIVSGDAASRLDLMLTDAQLGGCRLIGMIGVYIDPVEIAILETGKNIRRQSLMYLNVSRLYLDSEFCRYFGEMRRIPLGIPGVHKVKAARFVDRQNIF